MSKQPFGMTNLVAATNQSSAAGEYEYDEELQISVNPDGEARMSQSAELAME